MTSIEPGWYRDPVEPTTQRYWDGEGWIGEPIPADAQPPATAPAASQASSPPAPAAPLEVASPAPPPAPHPPGPHAPAPGPGTVGPEAPGPGTAGPPASGEPGAQPPVPSPVPVGQPPTPGPWPTDPTGQPVRWPPPGPWLPDRRRGEPPSGVPYPMVRPQPPAPRPHGFALASISARMLARLIDILVVTLLNVVVNGWFVWQYVQEVRPYVREVSERIMNGESAGDAELTGRAGWLQLTILGLAIALWFAYEVPATANDGQTLGKRLMRIKVLGVESQQPLGVRRAWRRWNPLGLSALLWTCYGFGFLLQAADLLIGVIDRPLHQTLHDKSAATVVVKVGGPNGKPPADTGNELPAPPTFPPAPTPLEPPAPPTAPAPPTTPEHPASPAPRDGEQS